MTEKDNCGAPKMETNATDIDDVIDAAGDTLPISEFLTLTVGCHTYVFTPEDKKRRCPTCDHPRFTPDGKPNETCFSAVVLAAVVGLV